MNPLEDAMAYLNCQNCRLTISEGCMFAPLAGTCPRCGGPLDRDPPRLFKRALKRASRRSAGLGSVPAVDRKPQPPAPLHTDTGDPEPIKRRS